MYQWKIINNDNNPEMIIIHNTIQQSKNHFYLHEFFLHSDSVIVYIALVEYR